MTVVSWYSSVHSHWYSKGKVRRFVSALHYHNSRFTSAKTLALANKLFHVHLIDWVIGFQMTGIFADNNFKSFLKVDLFTLKIWGHQYLVWDMLIDSRSSSIFTWPIWNSSTEGKNQTLVGAIPFCGEHPGPRFEDKFRSANQIDGIQ